MAQLRWKTDGKIKLAREMSFAIEADWNRTKKFLAEHKMTGNPSVDLEGMLDSKLAEYAYNPNWCTRRLAAEIIISALKSAWSHSNDEQFKAWDAEAQTKIQLWKEGKNVDL